VFLAQLNGIDVQRQQLAASESASDEHGEHRVIPLAPKRSPLHAGEQSLALLNGQPVSHPDSNPAHSLHSSNLDGQFRTKQAGVGGIKSNSADRSQSQLDGRGRVLLLLETDPVPQHYGAVEGRRGSEQYQSTNAVMAWS